MAVPGRAVPPNAPADLAARELFSVDAYLRRFEAPVEQVDEEQHRVALGRTAFYRAVDMTTEQALALLQNSLSVATTTDDAAEGVAAFAEKRTPVWKSGR